MQRKFQPPETCPVCGEDVPRTARACPECGADERSGWKEDAAIYDALDLPNDDEEREAVDGLRVSERKRRSTLKLFWQAIAALVFLALLIFILLNR